MSRWIQVDPALPPIAVSPRVLNEIASHARQTFPEECCGLVTGSARERFREAHACRNDSQDRRRAFFMSPVDCQAVMETAEARGEAVTAVYHSHAGVDAYFSELDQEHAGHALFPFPRADHIVVSIVEGQVRRWGLFQRAGDGFVGRALVWPKSR